MSDAVATASGPAPDQGLPSRAMGVIFSPGATFETVVRHPRPAGILFGVCLVIGLATAVPQFTERGQQAVLDMQVQTIERFTGRPIAPEMYAGMVAGARRAPYSTLVSVFVFVPAGTVFFSALYWFLFNAILGGTATFRQVLGVTSHAQVIAALGALLSAPVQYIQGVWTSTGPFNLGVLAPMLPPGSFLANYLGAISFFMLWQIVVTAIGLAVLYRRNTMPIAMGLTVAYLIVAAAITISLAAIGGS